MAQTKAQLLGPVVGDVVMDVSTLSLDAEGNKVGIGHSEPDLTLHVSGVDGLPSTSGSTSTGHLTLRDKATSTKGMFFGVSNASPFGSWIQAQDSANNATNYPLLLNPNGGNVGIGDDDPNYRLVVTGQDQAVMIRQGNGALAALTHNTSQKLWFQGGNAELGLFSDSSGNLEYILGTWQSVTHIPLVFRTGNRAERMRITFDGNVGINQNNPTKKLEVAGGAVSFSPDTAGKHTHEFTTNASNDGRYFIKSDTTTKVDIQANGTSYFNGGKFIVAGNAIQAHANMDDLQVGDGNGNRGITISSGATAYGTVAFGDSADGSGTDMYSGFVEYYHDDNSMRLGTSSGEKVRIDNLGRVSIGNGGTFTAAAVGRSIVEINGTSSSLINLDVGGTRKAYHFTDGTDVYSYNTANGSYIIGSNDTERFRIDSAGGHRIKCSESWTAANLAECNTTKLALNINQTRQGQTKGIAFGAIGSSSSSTGIQAYDTSNDSANPLLINPYGGTVGINKTSPSSDAQLDVVGSSYWPILVKTTATGGGGVAIKNKDDVTSLYVGSGGSSWLTGSAITDGLIRAQNNLIFASNGNSERLRITSGGYVGINEDIPNSQLSINYTGTQTTSSFKTATHIRLDGTSGANTMSGIGFGYANSGGNDYYPSAWIGTKVTSWTAYVKHDLLFCTRGVDTNSEPLERFRISENGDLKQYYNSKYEQKGYFDTVRSSQNASNAPTLSGSLSYAFGYQEAFSTSGGSWVNPYPDLVFGYHTGMRFGGRYDYGGCRFYADHPSTNSSIILSIGNGSSGVHVTNTLTAGTKTFRIAHPHPSKKYTHDLVHSVIEGPQCDNIYRGKVDLVNGTASINIDTVSNMTDGTFVLLNRDIQCFTSNETGWTAVKGSVSGNILTITAKSSSCTDTISWMVIGERQDDKIKSPEIETTDSDGKLITEPLTIEESHM